MSIQASKHIRVEAFRADGALTGKAGYAAKHGAEDEDAALASVEGGYCIGLILDGAADNVEVSILREGVEMAEVASSTYALGDELMTGADGKLKKATAGKWVIARCREKRTGASALPLQVEVVAPYRYFDTTALTAADASTVDGTYGAEEQAVIGNNRTRLGELAARLGLA